MILYLFKAVRLSMPDRFLSLEGYYDVHDRFNVL